MNNSNLDTKTRNNLIKDLKNDIKENNLLEGSLFFNRENFKDKIYLMILKKLQKNILARHII